MHELLISIAIACHHFISQIQNTLLFKPIFIFPNYFQIHYVFFSVTLFKIIFMFVII